MLKIVKFLPLFFLVALVLSGCSNTVLDEESKDAEEVIVEKENVPEQTNDNLSNSSFTEGEFVDWVIYENLDYGFRFKYPPENYLVEENAFKNTYLVYYKEDGHAARAVFGVGIYPTNYGDIDELYEAGKWIFDERAKKGDETTLIGFRGREAIKKNWINEPTNERHINYMMIVDGKNFGVGSYELLDPNGEAKGIGDKILLTFEFVE